MKISRRKNLEKVYTFLTLQTPVLVSFLSLSFVQLPKDKFCQCLRCQCSSGVFMCLTSILFVANKCNIASPADFLCIIVEMSNGQGFGTFYLKHHEHKKILKNLLIKHRFYSLALTLRILIYEYLVQCI